MDDRRAPTSRPTRSPGTFTPVTVAGRSGPLLAAFVLVIAFAIVVAVVKPWGGEATRPTGLIQAAPIATRDDDPSASPGTVAAAEIARMCLETGAWLVASEEVVAGRAVRIWRALAPEPSTGPDDPAIPWVFIASDSVSALGWCGPVVGAGRLADPTTVEASSVTGGVERPLALLRLRPTAAQSNLGGLYRPAAAPTALGPTTAWPTGRYLFRVRSGDGTELSFGVEVEVVPPRTPAVIGDHLDDRPEHG